jgi:2-polyprenyl-3-methyl-5-hydroxy-6-metoxy-1,4-benzoquinol methylase
LFSLTIIVGENILRIVPAGTHNWNDYINSEDVENIIWSEGLRTLDKKGVMVKNPLTLEMTEVYNWYRSNYIMISRKIE